MNENLDKSNESFAKKGFSQPKFILIIIVCVIFICGLFLGYLVGAREPQIQKVKEFSVNSATPMNTLVPTKQVDLVTKYESYNYIYDFLKKDVSTNADNPSIVHKLFSKEELSEFEANLIRPYFDYYNEKGDLGIVVINLHRKTVPVTNSNPKGYSTGLDVIYTNGETGAQFVYPDQKFWYPQCMDICGFSETFKKRYPGLVNSYNSE